MAIVHLVALDHYVVDRQPHILVDSSICRQCPHHACLVSCPAECYTQDPAKGIEFSYEACLECGTCRVVCDQGAVTWEYPRGGFGVGFRFA
jgi:ferredoxin like protein